MGRPTTYIRTSGPYEDCLDGPVVEAALIRVGDQWGDDQTDQDTADEALERSHGRAVHALHLHTEGAVADGVAGHSDEDDLHGGEQRQIGVGTAVEENERRDHGQGPVDAQGTDAPANASHRSRPAFGPSKALARPGFGIELRRAFEP